MLAMLRHLCTHRPGPPPVLRGEAYPPISFASFYQPHRDYQAAASFGAYCLTPLTHVSIPMGEHNEVFLAIKTKTLTRVDIAFLSFCPSTLLDSALSQYNTP